MVTPYDPLPGRGFPLPLVLEQSGMPREELLVWDPTTHSWSASRVYRGLRAIMEGSRRSADWSFKEALAREHGSRRDCTREYSDHKGAVEKSIVSLEDEVRERLARNRVPYGFYVKRYDDPDLVLRVAYLSKAMFWEAREDPSFPLAETLDYTLDHERPLGEDVPHRLISLSYGPSLEEELGRMRGEGVSRSNRAYRDFEDGILRMMLAHTHRTLHYLSRDDAAAIGSFGEAPSYLVPWQDVAQLLDRAQAETYDEKFVRGARWLGACASLPRRLRIGIGADGEAALVRERLEGSRFLPYADAKTANFAGSRNIDWEKVPLVLHNPAVLFAHAIFDPALQLPSEERMGVLIESARPYGVGEEGALAAAYYYLVRQAGISTQGMRANSPAQGERIRHRALGFLSLLRWLATEALPREYRTARALAGIGEEEFLERVRFL